MAQKSPTGPMPTLRFARVETALGPMWVVESDLGVAHVDPFDEPLDALLAALRRRFPLSEPMPDDLSGDWVESAVTGGPLPPVDLRGLSAFDAAVYRGRARGPTGRDGDVRGEVAAIVGSPMAARAVGNAMARCPLFPAVPCHRVVRASDGWSGWGGDPALKRRLLAAERATS